MNTLLQIQVNGQEVTGADGIVRVEKTLSVMDLLTSGGIGGNIIMLSIFILSIEIGRAHV